MTPGSRTIVVRALRRTGGRGKTKFESVPREPTRPAVQCVRAAAVARVLALAHHIEAAIRRGTFRNRGDVARRLGHNDSRITQVLNLLLLAPDIQEHVLFLEATSEEEPFTERALRAIAVTLDWDEQRKAYRRLVEHGGG